MTHSQWQLTASQRDILLDQLYFPDSPIYNIGGYIVCDNIDCSALAQAHKTLVRSHEAFGMRIGQQNGEFTVYLSQEVDDSLPLIDFSDQTDAELSAKRWLDTRFAQTQTIFDTQLARGFLLKISQQQYWYVGLSHHLAMDGFGFAIWVKQLAALYNSEKIQDDARLSLKEIAQLDNSYRDSTKYQKDATFWQDYLAGYQGERLAPRHHCEGDQQHSTRAIYPLSRALFDNLSEHAKQAKLGAAQVLLATLAYYFSLHTNQKALLFGNPSHNRKTALQKQKLSVFTSISPLLISVQGLDVMSDLVKQVAQAQKITYRHQRYPLGQLLKDQQHSGEQGSFFDFSFNYLTLDFTDIHFSDQAARFHYLNANAEKIPFTLTVWDNNDTDLELQIDFNHRYFNQAEVDAIEQRYQRALAYLSQHGLDCALSDLPFSSDAEQHWLLGTSHNSVSYDPQLSLHQQISHQAQLTPDAIAIEMPGGRTLSYAQLDAGANRIAAYLQHHYTLGADTMVGVSTLRHAEMVMVILAILKTGAAYLPLDPSYPSARLAQIIDDARPLVTITDTPAALDGLAIETLSVATLCQGDPALSYQPVAHQGDNLAYAIYTSGSTGKPKGVAIRHRNVNALLSWADTVYSREDYARVLCSTSINFDLSVFELFFTLTRGGTCVLVDNALSLLDHSLPVTLINTVPSAIKALLEQGGIPAGVRVVNLAGEPLGRDVVNQLLAGKHCERVYNLYGPSEDTTYSTCACFSEIIDDAPSIGRAISNTQALILNDQLALLPYGATGELYLGGDGLALGYLNQPELTAERFIDNPFYDAKVAGSSKRLYRTGDLVRYQADGNLAFVGRADDQIKIRGFRVELGEISEQLSRQAAIDSAVVVAKNGANGVYLVAYVQPAEMLDEESHVDFISQALNTLASRLPDYMVPKLGRVMSQWPLTASGKIDKKALPEVEAGTQQGVYVAPQNDTERAVCAIWAELLNIDAAKISATANFFELGGHSLLSLKLVAKLNQLGYQVSAKDAIRCTSVQQMAVLLDTAPAYNEVVSSSQIPAGCERITPEHLDLISLSQPQIDALCNQFAGGAANIQDIYPLASLQEGILYHHMLDPDNDPYVSWYLLALQSEAHLPLLLQAIQSVIDEHDILRTGFCWQGLDEPVQVVLRQAQLDVHYLDVPDTADPQQVMTAHLQSDKQSFDLHQAPLMRVTVAQTSEQCIIGVQMHHLIDDAMSLYAIQNQLQDYLEGPAKAQSRTQSRAQSQSGFRAVIAQRQQTQLKDAEAFFTHMLADVEEPSFPFGLTDVTGKGLGMDETSLTLASETSRQIRSLCERHRVSPAALFHSAWAMVLGACCNQPQVVLGTVLSGRMQSVGDAQMILGMLINTLPLKVDLQQSASQVIQQVQRGLMALTSFEHTPLAVATGCSAVATDTPLFSSLINYRHARELHTQDNALRLLDSFERTNYPFSVSVDDFVEQGDFVLSVQIDESVGARRIADYMVQAMRFLLAQLDADDGKPVAVADLLSAPERSQLLQAQRVENPWSELMIHQLFEHQAARNGAAIAIVDGQAELSYEQLNRQANQLAHYLRAQGHVGTDTIIGLCMERSPNMLIALLAVLKAGGAYLPLDPDYPQQRLTYMLEDSQVNLVLCSKACTQTLAGFTGDMVQLDTLLEGEVLQQHNVDNLSYGPSMQAPSALAYAMYTSGSTGQPKGVLIEHQNLTNFALNCETNYGLTGADRMLQFSTMNFDIFVEEWIASLCFGATLVLRNDQVMAGKQGFIAFCQQHCITVASLPTSFWHHLHLNASELAALSLRMIIVGGEALDVAGLEVIAAQQGRCVLMNTYGPTETTITATSLRIDHSTDLTRTITIGKPNPNMAAVVLGQSGQLCPLGVAGELHLGGRGLARGYLGLEQANKEKFVLNQSVNGLPAWASRLYKTGDLVRVNQAGELEFLGRVDEQVKIRGFRVELSEIEHRLMALAGVERALVLANQSHGAQPQLVAYVEFQQHEAAPDSDQLKLLLQAQLPNYMVPSHFVAITDWPLLPSGKVNRKALPAPVSSQSAAPYQAARTETEQQVQQICADLLERPFDTLSVTANFFELGGHSLLVMRLVTRLNDTFAINLAIQDLYQQMTVANISRHIDDVLTLHVSDARTEQSAAVSDLEEFTL